MADRPVYVVRNCQVVVLYWLSAAAIALFALGTCIVLATSLSLPAAIPTLFRYDVVHVLSIQA